MRCAVYREAKRWEDLEVIARGALAKHPEEASFRAFIATAAHHQGRTEEALRLLADQKELKHLNAPTCYAVACNHGRQGQITEARHWLSLAFEWTNEPDKLKLKALDAPDLRRIWENGDDK